MNKKSLYFIVAILIILIASCANGENLKNKISKTFKGDIGVGIILGEPTGISFKIFTADKRAVDLALAWALKKNQYLRIHMDYLFNENKYLVKEFDLPLSLTYGLGIKLITGTSFTIGIRFYTGVFHRFKSPDSELFFEFVPSMIIIPATVFDIDGAFGFRFYLKRKSNENT